MKKILTLFMGLIFISTLAGCNTFSGAGKDLQKGGKAITRSAERNKPAQY